MNRWRMLIAGSVTIAVLALGSLSGVLVRDSVTGDGPGAASAYSVEVTGDGIGLAEPDAPALAGGPSKLQFNGVLTDSGTGNPVAQGNYSMTFSLWTAATAGTKLWEEGQTVNVKKSGVFNTFLGVNVVFPDGLFETGALFVEIKIGADPPLSPRQELAHVPRSFFSDKADKANQADKADKAAKADKAETTSNPGYKITSLDTAGVTGENTVLVIGSDGLPVIAYWHETANDLKVAHCDDIACAVATITTVDGTAATPITLAVGQDGFPLITYGSEVAHCTNVECSTSTTLDLSGLGLYGSSSTIGTDGLAIIANGAAGLLHCSNVACTTGTLAGPGIGNDASLTIGRDGFPIASYQDGSSGPLMVLHCHTTTCAAFGPPTVAVLIDGTGDVGAHSSVTIGSDGLAVISYFDETNYDLKVAHCSDVACSTATITTLDSVGSCCVGEKYTSITIGSDGLALISYNAFPPGPATLNVAHCDNAVCTSASLVTVDDPGGPSNPPFVGYFSSIAIGTDGLPMITYWDSTNGDLKTAHCSNRFCLPYHRSR